MNNFSFNIPTQFYFGRGEEIHVGDRIRQFGGHKVLVVYGGNSAVKSGLIERVRLSIERANIQSALIGGVQANPRSGLVNQAIGIARLEAVDFILAVGGGSVIDTAKAIAIGALYSGDFWDFFSGKAIPQRSIPLGTILTIAAAGSEVSPVSVITQENGMLKRPYSNDRMRPVFSILNPSLTFSLPAYQTASGATDIMAHVLERYFTNTQGVEMTDRLCESVLLTVISELPKALKNPENYEARANLMWASTLAHSNICGTDRDQDWSSHALEHELSGLYDCAHGAGLAVVMPAWMEYVMSHDIPRFVRFAQNVWGCTGTGNPESIAKAGIQAFRNFLKTVGMPLTFREIGAKAEDIPYLLDQLHIENGTIGSFVRLDRKACETIYRIAASDR